VGVVGERKRRSPDGLALVVLLAGAALITLPFIFKAFHLDDTVFVWLGQEKLHDPFALGLPDHGYEGNFFSLYLDTHPPLFTTYLSLLIRLFGGAYEWGLHLGMVIFPALAAVSMYFLARRFTGSALVSALLLIVTPGFMVMAQSVMTDVPALSLWLAAIAAYVYGVDREGIGRDGGVERERDESEQSRVSPDSPFWVSRGTAQMGSTRLLVLAGIFMSLAVLTTYQSLSLVPLLFVYALLARRINMKTMLPLLAALAVFGAIVVYYLAATGHLPKLSYSIGLNLGPSFLANKILAIVSAIGGATIFPVLLAVGLLKGKKDYLAFAALFAALLVLFLMRVSGGEYTPIAAILQAVFYSAGLLAFYRFFSTSVDSAVAEKRTRADLDNIFLIIWIAGVLVYSVLLLPYASTRYLLPMFPPVVLMFIRYSSGIFADSKAWRNFAVAAVACTAAAGLAVSIADYRLAGVYRDFATTQAGELESQGHQLWFAGEFGLRYYLEQNGGRYLTSDDNSPQPGDRVVLSHGLIAYFISGELKNRLQLERSLEYPSAWPVRMEGAGSQAGFYDQFHGNLPWSLSTDPVETIDIYTVK